MRGKSRGVVPEHLPPILDWLGIAAEDWLPLATRFGRPFHQVAGAPRTLARLKPKRCPRPDGAVLLGAG